MAGIHWVRSHEGVGDAEQSTEHLPKANKRICVSDLVVQRALAKSHASQSHVERVVTLVENQYRAILFDVQERIQIEVEPTSAATAWLRQHARLGFSIALDDTSLKSVSMEAHTHHILPLFVMVQCLTPSDRKPGGALVVAKGSPRTFRCMWVG